MTTFFEIKDGVIFRGHNLWLLILSMGIACVGLNVNNAAAIIGAMLISPLMGPVVGLAFGISIQNRGLVRLSLYHWGVMVVTALTASTVYFLISPFHQATSQLSSFTQATVFDCFLAIFGGLAWFLGLIRKEAIKVIAGVAVSTACIPPLCTAGYGLANAHWNFFFGGLYFYLINCVYIGIGTWLMSLLLGYQRYFLKKNPNPKSHKVLLLTLISAVVVIPSAIFTYKKWQEEQLRQQAEEYITVLKQKNAGLDIVKYELQPATAPEEKPILDITVLNDSLFLSKAELRQHNAINKAIDLRWHYVPDQRHNRSDLNKIRKELDSLKMILADIQKKNTGSQK